ncbi:MAG: hypothetical protein MZV70_50175 [Desulfobacterales bacterium]|nr:hypothetical protein [Desulfobacterales bacterium]
MQWLTHLNPLSYFLVIIRGHLPEGHRVRRPLAAVPRAGGARRWRVFALAIRRFRKRID